MAGAEMGKGSANSPTVVSPRARRARMARRVGSARAANAASGFFITSTLINKTVKYKSACNQNAKIELFLYDLSTTRVFQPRAGRAGGRGGRRGGGRAGGDGGR